MHRARSCRGSISAQGPAAVGTTLSPHRGPSRCRALTGMLTAEVTRRRRTTWLTWMALAVSGTGVLASLTLRRWRQVQVHDVLTKVGMQLCALWGRQLQTL